MRINGGNCLTHECVEPEGQVFFHWQQAGIMAVRQPLVVLLRTGKARPRVSVLLAEKTVHPQPGQVPRAQRTVKAGVHHLHFTVHYSALVGLWQTLVANNKCFFMLLLGFDFNILDYLSHPLRGRQSKMAPQKSSGRHMFVELVSHHSFSFSLLKPKQYVLALREN